MGEQEEADLSSTMDRASVPQQVDRTAQVAQEMTEEGLDVKPVKL